MTGQSYDGTKIHALYGYPIGYSLSPVIFNAAFEDLGLNRRYVAFPVRVENLERAVDAARALGFEGFNVTMPHKERVTSLLDGLEGEAKETGAVNTVTRRPLGFVGYNTDGEGAIRALQTYGFEPDDQSILIVGAGGAASAIVNSLAKVGGEIVIVNRTLERARKIVARTSGKSNLTCAKLSKENLSNLLAHVSLVVNATPLQTNALLQQYGVIANDLPRGLWVFDLAYGAELGKQRSNTFNSVSPLELLLQQAALSYEIWLGEMAPFETMRRALINHLGYDWRSQK